MLCSRLESSHVHESRESVTFTTAFLCVCMNGHATFDQMKPSSPKIAGTRPFFGASLAAVEAEVEVAETSATSLVPSSSYRCRAAERSARRNHLIRR